MKLIPSARYLTIFLLVAAFGEVFPILAPAQPIPLERCGSEAYRLLQIQSNSDYLKKKIQIDRFTDQFMDLLVLENRSVITIPVVVHVVWNKPVENISDLQIQTQLDALNTDFRRLNEDIDNVPDEFRQFIADAEVEFCLATLDPSGRGTTGITRTQTPIECIGSQLGEGNKNILHYASLGGVDSWDPTQYLNIWVASTCGILGRSSFPAQAGEPEDGIVVDPAYFGTTCLVEPPYHRGRTATHEIGHYFNLEHPWGSIQGECMEEDKVEDTPIQDKAYSGCPAYPQESCGTSDMFMNFMNFVDDDCMHFFTEGQKARMMATLMGPRASLLESVGCAVPQEIPRVLVDRAVKLFPNPTNGCINISVSLDSEIPIQIIIYDASGRLVYQIERVGRDIRSLDLSFLPKGIYFLELVAEQRRVERKVVIY